MSLLKRIESAKPGGEGAPATGPTPPPGGAPPPGVQPPPGTGMPPGAPGAVAAPPAAMPQRVISQVPVRESFRDTKYRIQQRVISDLDPKLDLP